jgi:hypothetical protein
MNPETNTDPQHYLKEQETLQIVQIETWVHPTSFYFELLRPLVDLNDAKSAAANRKTGSDLFSYSSSLLRWAGPDLPGGGLLPSLPGPQHASRQVLYHFTYSTPALLSKV